MKRQWHIRRRFQVTEDSARRWDQVYQLLLEWSQHADTPLQPAPSLCLQPPGEDLYEDGRLCPRLDPAPKPGADD